MTSLAIALRTRTFRSLRRHRNYRIFFDGQLVSLAGSWMQNVALAWLVLELSGSPSLSAPSCSAASFRSPSLASRQVSSPTASTRGDSSWRRKGPRWSSRSRSQSSR